MSVPESIRNDFLDYLKGLLIVLVAWGHLIQFVGYQGQPGYYENPLFKWIYSFHMPLFMAVSGYVSFRPIAQSKWLDSIRRRFRQVIVPAISWPPLYLIAKFVIFLLVAGTVAGGCQLFREFMVEYRPGYWFLWAVFGAGVVVALLRLLRLDRVEFFLLATLLMLLAPEGAYLYLIKYTFPFFCLGYALAKRDQIALPASVSWPLILFFGVATLGCCWFWNHDSYIYTTRMRVTVSNLPNIGLRWLSGMVVSAFFTILALGLYRGVKSALLSKLGRRSLDIYILHLFLVEILQAFFHPAMGSVWFCWLLAPVLAVLLCFCSVRIADGLLYSAAFWAILFGRTSRGADLGKSASSPQT